MATRLSIPWRALVAGALVGTVALLAIAVLGTAQAAVGGQESPAAFTYAVELPNGSTMRFQRCFGPGSESDVIEYKTTTGGTDHIRLMPGRLRTHPLTCSRAVSDDMTAQQWRDEVVAGRIVAARTTATITLFDGAGVPRARWQLDSAWPSELVVVEGTELLTVVAEGVTRVTL